uniref:HECT domain-containing protein n=1 Tax=Globodera pallida TaxID=36090 RepID=A0A183CNV5_GLOPA
EKCREIRCQFSLFKLATNQSVEHISCPITIGMPSAANLSPARLCSLLLALFQQRKYAARPVLTMYAVQMQLLLPFLLRSGAVVNTSALLRPFRRMYAKGVEFDAHTLLTIACA